VAVNTGRRSSAPPGPGGEIAFEGRRGHRRVDRVEERAGLGAQQASQGGLAIRRCPRRSARSASRWRRRDRAPQQVGLEGRAFLDVGLDVLLAGHGALKRALRERHRAPGQLGVAVGLDHADSDLLQHLERSGLHRPLHRGLCRGHRLHLARDVHRRLHGESRHQVGERIGRV